MVWGLLKGFIITLWHILNVWALFCFLSKAERLDLIDHFEQSRIHVNEPRDWLSISSYGHKSWKSLDTPRRITRYVSDSNLYIVLPLGLWQIRLDLRQILFFFSTTNIICWQLNEWMIVAECLMVSILPIFLSSVLVKSWS